MSGATNCPFKTLDLINPEPPYVSLKTSNIMRFVDRTEIIIHYARAMQNFLTPDPKQATQFTRRRWTDLPDPSTAL